MQRQMSLHLSYQTGGIFHHHSQNLCVINIPTDKDLAPKKLKADSAFANATKQVERMNVFVQPVNEQAKVKWNYFSIFLIHRRLQGIIKTV